MYGEILTNYTIFDFFGGCICTPYEQCSSAPRDEWRECSLAQSISQVFKSVRENPPPRPATFYLKRAARQLAVRAKSGGTGRSEG